ncbi:MAG TPA: DUF4331 family protein [Candidatus Eisenbacteria bacterium]|jgi:hypothetical protein
MKRLSALCTLAVTVGLLAAPLQRPARASSHSEAPGTVRDRLADDTDLYAWVSPDAPDRVTLVGNWVPLLEPASGPNFFAFDEDVSYWFNIDNVGDARDHIRYRFTFRTERRTGATFLYNTGVVNSLDSPSLNVRQFYTVTRYDNGVPTVLATDLQVAPAHVGPVSMPHYAALAQAAVVPLPDGSKVFVGPRDDPFFVDLGAIFDLLTIRKVPGDKGKGVDGLGGFDVMTIALQVPMTKLTSDGQAPNANNSVLGIYTTAERAAQRTLNGDGTVSTSGDPVQVSRLGMPLVNEVVIALKDKDRFNATKPTGDGAFLSYVTDPELAHLLTLLYGIATPPAPRNDLVAVFLTGIPGLNQPANPNRVACEMLRLNMNVAPTANPERLGLLAGDVAGFPNGRRLGDDVVDIAERVVAGATPFTPPFDVAPNNRLGDGVDANDRPFLPYFPYLAPPHDPLEHRHHAEQSGDAEESGHGRHGRGGRGRRADAERAEGLEMRLGSANPGPAARFELSLPSVAHVTLKVYDLQGRVVRTLLDQDAAPGPFVATWDGMSDAGLRMAGGIYFARLSAGSQVIERKIVLE